MAMTDVDKTHTEDDPFTRAVAREQAYRERRSRSSIVGFPTAIFKTFRLVALGAIVAWAGLLAVHWRLLGEPRWLAVMHTMVFGIGCIYLAAVFVMFTVMRRKPEAFGISEVE